LEFLCEYDFDINHIKGKENKVVDALNRGVHEIHATTISMYQTDIKGRILEAANVDLQYMELVAKIQQGKMLQKVEGCYRKWKIINWKLMEHSCTKK
jgi:hypothetical protein